MNKQRLRDKRRHAVQQGRLVAVHDGNIFRLTDTSTDGTTHKFAVKQLCIKYASDIETAYMVRGLTELSRLSHDHVVTYVDSWQDDNYINVMTEYYDDGNLITYMQQQPRPVSDQTHTYAKWLRELSSALQYIQSKRMIHRNIKPSNIMVARRSSEIILKLGDFGIAKSLERDACGTNTFVGSPGFISPEIMAGKDYDWQTDVWSLGICFYSLVTGQLTSTGSCNKTVIGNVSQLKERDFSVPMKSDCCSERLCQIIQTMMNRDPSRRPRPDQLVESMTRILEELKISTPDTCEGLAVPPEISRAQCIPAFFKTRRFHSNTDQTQMNRKLSTQHDQTKSNRSSSKSDTDQTKSKRNSSTSDTDQTKSKRNSSTSDADQTKSKRNSSTSDADQTKSNRSSSTSDTDQTTSNRSSQTRTADHTKRRRSKKVHKRSHDAASSDKICSLDSEGRVSSIADSDDDLRTDETMLLRLTENTDKHVDKNSVKRLVSAHKDSYRSEHEKRNVPKDCVSEKTDRCSDILPGVDTRCPTCHREFTEPVNSGSLYVSRDIMTSGYSTSHSNVSSCAIDDGGYDADISTLAYPDKEEQGCATQLPTAKRADLHGTQSVIINRDRGMRHTSIPEEMTELQSELISTVGLDQFMAACHCARRDGVHNAESDLKNLLGDQFNKFYHLVDLDKLLDGPQPIQQMYTI